jgi:hypothetical protein
LSDIGVFGAQPLLTDSKGALVERLGLGIEALAVVEPGEVVEGGGDGGMVGAKFPLRKAKRPFGNPRCFGVLTGLIELNHLPVERVEIIGGLCLRP